MNIKHLPGAPGNHNTLPLSHRTLHLMRTTEPMQLQRQPEQQHGEGGAGGGAGGGENGGGAGGNTGGGSGGDNGGAGGAGGGSQQQQQNQVSFSTEQQTEIARLIGEERKKWDQTAQTARDQETQRAEQEKLRQQGEFEKLAGTEKERADKAEREVAELKLNADRVTACQDAGIDVKHASRLVGTNLAELTADAKEFAKSIPLPKAASLQQSGTQGGASSGGQQNGNGAGNGNNNGGGGGNAPYNPGLQHVNDRYSRPDKKRS